MTFKDLVAKSQACGRPYGESTFLRAASGVRVPGREVVEAFAQACGLADPNDGARLWEAADRERTPKVSVQTLSAELSKIHKARGHTLRTLENRPGGGLPRNTLRLILDGTRAPSARHLDIFLAGCKVPGPTRSRLRAMHEELVAGDPKLAAREESRRTPPPTYICGFAERAHETSETAREIKARTGTRDDFDEEERAIRYANHKAARW
ncbi:hypothetical protein ACFZBU_47745 [Embleya sp. NPDC008237]|uniref:hypothetical protein n=1 Tax=Embleya sp. NPDC008237 TaxID=3363978 RepID=UPI0036EAA05D